MHRKTTVGTVIQVPTADPFLNKKVRGLVMAALGGRAKGDDDGNGVEENFSQGDKDISDIAAVNRFILTTSELPPPRC